MNQLTFFLLSLGKRKRVPTQKAVESDLDFTLKIKDEGNQESDIESAPKIAKTDEEEEEDSTEVSKEVLFSEKENKKPIEEAKPEVKPGEKVKKPPVSATMKSCSRIKTSLTPPDYWPGA